MRQTAAQAGSPAATGLRQWAVWVTGFRRTIRGRILVAFLLMSMITAALGVYAVHGVKLAGTLVAKTFDESLMSINYARAAAADFAAMRAAFARRWISTDPEMRAQLDDSVDNWRRSLQEDLDIAAKRSQSQRAARAAANMQLAVANWNSVRLRMSGGAEPEVNWDTLDHYTTIVEQQIDLLVNYTAGDAFLYRQSARSTVTREIYINLAFTALAVLISAAVAWLLARRIIGPVAAASAAAGQIAGSKLDVEIPQGSADELGTLLSSMRLMRDNIKTMMTREVEQRRSAQMRLADALESSTEGVVLVDANGRLALANSQAADFLGMSIQLLRPGTPVAKLGPLMEKATRAQLPPTGEARLDDGRWLRVSQSATSDGGSIVVCSDISLLKQQEETLKGTNLRLDAALDNMSQGLCLFDRESRLQVVNRRFWEIFGLPREKLVPGMTFRDILELSVAAGNHPGKSVQQLIDDQRRFIGDQTTGTHFVELTGSRVVACTHRPTSEGGVVATYEDVTERRQAEARIAYMARHDALTGLPNRVLFGERVEQAIADMGRGNGFAVLSVDVDHFKQVNDTLGHPIGDELLRAVAERLQSCIREIDTVGRLGGDEFAVVQRNVRQPEDAALLARRIIEIAGAPYDINGHRVTIGISIGISLAPNDGSSCEKLLKNSDVALYRAKSDGRGTWRFFESEMDARLQARLALEHDLREALNNDQFELHYQPVYHLERNRISGFEALLRWNHPMRGRVSPGEFIPVAEEIGLIIPLGAWVLQRACAEARNWPEEVRLAVNVSPAQFKSGQLVQQVTSALAASGLPAQRLELEITESVLLGNNVETVATLHALRRLGLRISMDDFGTGYSSLNYLRSFPLDKIKIDQCFVRDLGTTEGSGFIVRTIIGLAKSLKMTTTAEGVETEEQLSWLRAEGCTEVQGYLFSLPRPASEVPGLLSGRKGIGVAA
jgi:diguanylate cyclase (GGDEF)-like protein/PAS domain S-box-containing protein